MQHSEELQSILSRFGAGPVPRDQIVDYLIRGSSQASEQHAKGVLEDLEKEGYLETLLEKKGELVRFTDKAIEEVYE